MVPRARIELATQGFSVLRSTTELPRRGDFLIELTTACPDEHREATSAW